MDSLLNVFLGFIEGFALIISPCIFPILPIILAGSLAGSKMRPFGITMGFVLLFTVFTYLSRLLVQSVGIDLNTIRHISYGLLMLLGLVMVSSTLSDKFNELTSRFANIGTSLKTANNSEGGFISGLLFGGLIALIWTPCGGPILAAVVVQSAVQKTNFLSVLTLLAFALGAAVPMLMIALFGRKLTNKFSFFKLHAQFFRRTLGVIIILSVVNLIYSEHSVKSEVRPVIINHPIVALQNALVHPYAAPDIEGITAWINSPPLTMSSLKGKIVLIDFWTYSCINCIRTLPYLKGWYEKYHDKGLVIIGIHTPEFEFEKNLDNVKNAVKEAGLQYPVALDSQFDTWQNYHNQYWPAHYLIDKEGRVVYAHFGEGDYDVTENNIRYLLGERSAVNMPHPHKEKEFGRETPETYFGYARAKENKSLGTIKNDREAIYAIPSSLNINEWALSGHWKILSEAIVSMKAGATLKLHFQARKVFIVMGTSDGQVVALKLTFNGKPLAHESGKDVVDSKINVSEHRLYEAMVFDHTTEGVIELTSLAPGLELYTFTFGE